MENCKKSKKEMEKFHKKVYNTVKFLLENEKKVTERGIGKKYSFDRNLVGRIICKIVIENAFKEFDDEKKLDMIANKPISLFRSLLLLKSRSNLEIYDFFLCFGNDIESLNVSNAKELKEILDLYLSKQIRSYNEYLKLKIKRKNTSKDERIKSYKVLVKKLEEEISMLRKRVLELENSDEMSNKLIQKTLETL